MLVKLYKSKKLFSFIFLIVSVLIILPLIFFVGNDVVKFFAVIALLAHFILALIYYKKGISVAVMCSVYYVFFYFEITLIILLNRFISMDLFLESQIINSIGIAVFVIFTVVIPIPRIIKEKINGKLLEKGVFVNEPKEEKNGFDYDSFIKFRKETKYNESPNSIVNVTGVLRTLRMIISTLFFVVGFFGIIMGINKTDDSKSILTSQGFWVTVCSFALLILGFVILIVGLKKGLISALLLAFLGITIYYVNILLDDILGISLILHCLVAISFILLFAIIVFTVIKNILKKQKQTLTVYEENDSFNAVDLFLRETSPIIDYKNLLRFRISIDGNIKVSNLDIFNDNLLIYCSFIKTIYAGAVLDPKEKNYTVYIYFKTEEQEKKLRRYLKRKIKYNSEINIENDPQWDLYKTILSPSDITLIKLHNRNIMETFEKENFDLTNAVPLVLTAIFENKEEAMEFCEVTEEIYENSFFDESTKYVHVQKTMKVSEEWLNIETVKFYHLAKEYGGKYEFINMGEIKE